MLDGLTPAQRQQFIKNWRSLPETHRDNYRHEMLSAPAPAHAGHPPHGKP